MASSGITLTASMRSNLLNLQNTQKLFDATQERLSTGKKVNSALDNPSSYFTAQSLTTRADSLESLLDGMGQAVQTITAADESITSLKKMVDQASALANNARDTANTASYVLGSIDTTKLGSVTELGGVAAGDEFTIRLGDGDSIVGTKNLTLTQTIGELGLSAGASLAIKVGDGNFVSVAIASSDTIEAVAKKINENTKLKGTITASVVDGKFQLKTSDPKNAVTIRSVTSGGDAVTTTASIDVASILGLNAGFQVAIQPAGVATITGGALGIASTANIVALGVSPTPAKVRVAVGENTTDIVLTAGTNMSAVAAALSKVAGVTVAYTTTAGFTVTGDAGKAIQITDIEGNFADKSGLKTANFVKPTTGSFEELVNTINQLSTDLKAEIDKNGKLKISATNGEQFTITDVVNGNGVTGNAASAMGVSGLADNGANTRKSYSEQFNQIMDQIDQMVNNADTSYKGINLLNGDDLAVNFNEKRTSSLLIKGSVMNAEGLGLNNAKNQWRTAADIDAALANIDTATARLETKASELGQNLNIIQTRQDFTENMINTLTTGADNLTLADMNEEAANLLALQTRQQLATNALSLASQSQQSVLSLF